MHILFVHQNYPAQFGHIARYLVKRHGFRCSFLSNKPAGLVDGIQRYQYTPIGGATKTTHYCVRTFENAVAHAHGVHAACRQFPGLKPDLIVGHSGFGSTLFLRELFDCPILNYFEYFYHPHGSDLDFRPEFLPREIDFLRSYCRNAMILLDLNNCDRGYSPTVWQRSLFPPEYLDKIEVIFDGVDRAIWSRVENPQRVVAGEAIPNGVKIVTYVSRGFEAMRGFDIFMKAAKRIAQRDPDVLFIVVGSDRVSYGGDLKYIQEKSFREHVLKQDDYDLSRFRFVGTVPPQELARIFSLSDAHIYLTVPFVLSWSLFDALACGATVIASDTPPVRELIEHNRTGLLAPFHDDEAIAEATLAVLRDPRGHRHLARAGMELIEEKYTLDRCLPRLLDLYQRVAQSR
ncbi:glycosyl transferase group 1 [Isosphaera pallida ATCC 43644]|uniref:Glycosyl transferase group 1 n=1 Tax=Isosphaera pallida (strain ATCC 43644 / DSM 9630 / IS1B) TaxID=575540 RepID=E8QZB9_ISOPI|nr:glycosyltransferase [Isosphaera pallida]ADV64248.1 glycosyl transferase group 1 [Isosphaera pallida ATCC 43644]